MGFACVFRLFVYLISLGFAVGQQFARQGLVIHKHLLLYSYCMEHGLANNLTALSPLQDGEPPRSRLPVWGTSDQGVPGDQQP